MRTIYFGERNKCVLVRREVVLTENYHWINEETTGQFRELLENVYMGAVTNEEMEARKHQLMPLNLQIWEKKKKNNHVAAIISL